MARGALKSDFGLPSSFRQTLQVQGDGFTRVGIGRETDISNTDSFSNLDRKEKAFKGWMDEKRSDGRTNRAALFETLEDKIDQFATQEDKRIQREKPADEKDAYQAKTLKVTLSTVIEVEGQKMQFIVPDLKVRVGRNPMSAPYAPGIDVYGPKDNGPGVWYSFKSLTKTDTVRVRLLD